MFIGHLASLPLLYSNKPFNRLAKNINSALSNTNDLVDAYGMRCMFIFSMGRALSLIYAISSMHIHTLEDLMKFMLHTKTNRGRMAADETAKERVSKR